MSETLENRALGSDDQVRSEMAELRDHLSLQDDVSAADVVARAKLVAEWPSCFDLIADDSHAEIVGRAVYRMAEHCDLLETAWGVIANAGGWPGTSEPSPGWLHAAERWRDAWHALLSDHCAPASEARAAGQRDQRDQCGCHRDCTTVPHDCERSCRWPSCLDSAEQDALATEVQAQLTGAVTDLEAGIVAVSIRRWAQLIVEADDPHGMANRAALGVIRIVAALPSRRVVVDLGHDREGEEVLIRVVAGLLRGAGLQSEERVLTTAWSVVRTVTSLLVEHEVSCPECDTTIRARMADRPLLSPPAVAPGEPGPYGGRVVDGYEIQWPPLLGDEHLPPHERAPLVPALVDALRELGQPYGPMGVAMAAARLSHPPTVRRLLDPDQEPTAAAPFSGHAEQERDRVVAWESVQAVNLFVHLGGEGEPSYLWSPRADAQVAYSDDQGEMRIRGTGWHRAQIDGPEQPGEPT